MLGKHERRPFHSQQGIVDTKLGMYPQEWSIRRLSDVTDIRVSNVDKKRISGERPVLLCNYMDVLNNDYVHNQIEFMKATATESEMRKFALKAQDVIITKDSETREEIAECCVVIEDLENVVCGYHLAILGPKTDCVSGFFLKDILRSPTVHQQFVKFANGITRFGLTLSAIHGALVPLPPLPEQRKIAEILGTWDKVIALTEQLIAAKQQRKKGLMQQLLTGKRRFKEFTQSNDTYRTGLGDVPVDWGVVQVQDIAQVNAENLSERTDPDAMYLYIDLSSVDRGIISISQGRRHFADLPSRARRVLHKNDIIMATVRPNLLGFALCDFEPQGVLCSTGFALISSRNRFDSEFIYQSLYGDGIQRQVQGLVTGSNYPAINSSDVRKLKLLWPKAAAERKSIGAVLRACDDEIDLLGQKRDELRRQKKGLMQQLLTGRVRVKV